MTAVAEGAAIFAESIDWTERALSIGADFAHFGSDIAQLRKKLRGLGAELHDSAFHPTQLGSVGVLALKTIRL